MCIFFLKIKCDLSQLNIFPFQPIHLIMAVCEMCIHGYLHTQAFTSNIFFQEVQKLWPHNISETALQMHEARH